MAKQPNSENFSWLARKLLWVDKPGSADKLYKILAVACGLLLLSEFTFHKHIVVLVEHIPGYYGIFGFVMFTALILAAKFLRTIIKRPEDYYAPKSIDTEEYPDADTERLDHDA